MFLSRNGLRKLGHSLDILGTFEVPQEVIYYILKTTLFWIKKKEYSRKLWEKQKREGERYIRLRDNGASRVRNKQKWKIMSTLTDTRELHLNVTSFKYSQEFYTIISKQQQQQEKHKNKDQYMKGQSSLTGSTLWFLLCLGRNRPWARQLPQ